MIANRLLVPDGASRRVLVRPPIGWGALGAGIAAVVCVVVFLAEGIPGDDPWAWALILLPPVLLSALGALQASWWRTRIGNVRYEADAAGLRVVRGDTVIHAWAWHEVHKLRVEGGMSWYSLLVHKKGVEGFPRVVIHTGQGITRAPGVLVWGQDAGGLLERQLADLRRNARVSED